MPHLLSLAIFLVYGFSLTISSLVSITPGTLGANDKLLHFVAYFVFAVLAWPVSRSRRNTFLWLCVAITVYSIALEFAQSLTATRTQSGADMLANTAGVIAAATGILLWQHSLHRDP